MKKKEEKQSDKCECGGELQEKFGIEYSSCEEGCCGSYSRYVYQCSKCKEVSCR